MQNPDIARLFDEVADLLEIQGANPFRVRAYRNAARIVRDYPEPLADVVRSGERDLTEIPGIGDDLAEKITAIVTTGELPLRTELAAQLPPGLLDLLRIPGLGPKRVKELHDKLQVTSAADLAQAVEAGRVEELKGFGPKMVEKIRAGLGQAERVELRQLAQEKGLKLNEYGLYRGERRVAAATEAEIYHALGLDWIPPELREARGEIALAREHRLPALVSADAIRGDLQMHTTASDGQATFQAMAEAARGRGYAYIAITDHSKRVTMARGLDPSRLRAQWKEIDEWNAATRGFTILKSVELDILEDGTLDLPDDVLAEADYVVATMHYGLNQPERQLTERLVGAAEHPWVDAIGHPTGRLLGKREPYPLAFDALCRAAAGAGCLLELNGNPERMDLPDTLAAAAKGHGVRFVLSTDSHQPGHLAFMRYAVDLARRAGLEAGDVLNTRPLSEFKSELKRARK